MLALRAMAGLVALSIAQFLIVGLLASRQTLLQGQTFVLLDAYLVSYRVTDG